MTKLQKQFEEETGFPAYGRGLNCKIYTDVYVNWLEEKTGQHETIVMWRFKNEEHRLYIGGKNVASIVENSEGRFAWFLWDEDGVGGQNSSERTLYEAKVQAGGRAIIDYNELVAT